MLFPKHFTIMAKPKLNLFFKESNTNQLQFSEPWIIHTSMNILANALSTTSHPISTCCAMKPQDPTIMLLCRGHTALNAQGTHSLVWSSQPHNPWAISTLLTRVWPYELTALEKIGDKTKVCRNNLNTYLMYLFKIQINQTIQVEKKKKKRDKIAMYTEGQLKYSHKSVRQPSFTTAAIQNNTFYSVQL